MSLNGYLLGVALTRARAIDPEAFDDEKVLQIEPARRHAALHLARQQLQAPNRLDGAIINPEGDAV
ncbi:hypothetical protein [Rhodopseudomonas sp. BR0G17]|uniref:hypothetical protein n=1 Tax=Rhodopseudomonas sp. BR0G17 TaxID=2269368 RepID=UPI0013DEAC85|nr:hypothetical protein [Rhodopseudomonas sp. BR0G17]NEW96611.1 hypothetical protein [Rhodopseudomonas sp. BR0G17]